MKSPFPWLALILALLETAVARPQPREDWRDLARRLTGTSSATRAGLMQKLRRFPGIEASLLEAVRGPDRFLALDVISTLKLRALIPSLTRMLDQDDTGYVVHALNAMAIPGDRGLFVDLYRKKLLSGRPSVATRLALLDSLMRLEIPLDRSDLKALLRDPSPDIRKTTLHYVRYFLLRQEQSSYLSLVEIALEDPAFQLRVQAFYLLSELPPPQRRRFSNAPSICQADSASEVRKTCERLR